MTYARGRGGDVALRGRLTGETHCVMPKEGIVCPYYAKDS
jgi:hypothetical protein